MMSTSKGSILLTGANRGIGIDIVEELPKNSYAITHQGFYLVMDPVKTFALRAALEKAPRDHPPNSGFRSWISRLCTRHRSHH